MYHYPEKNYTNSGESTTVAGELTALAGEIEGLNKGFTKAFESMETSCAGIKYGDWDDGAQDKIDAYVQDVVLVAASAVRQSMMTSVQAMIDGANGLAGKLTSLASAQDDYVKLKANEPPKKIYYDDKGFETKYLTQGGSSVDNPKWDAWDKDCYAAETAMDGMIGDINSGLDSLASTEFVPPGAQPKGGQQAPAGNEEKPADETQIFDANGGADGRHFTTREDAILATMAANPGMSREDAEALVARRLNNATLFLSPAYVDEIIIAGEEVSEEAAMAAGLAIPTEETVTETEPSNRGDTDDDGTDNYMQDRHTEQTFETTDGQEAHRTEDLTIEGEIKHDQDGEEVLSPERAEGTAHYETSDGETYTGDITIDYTHDGESFNKDESITQDSTGEHVADVNTHQVRDYHNDALGTDVNVTDTTVEQGGMVTGKREQTVDYGRPGTTYVESDEWSYVLPEAGQPVSEGRIVRDAYDNPVTYSYERNDQGQLIETYTYPTRKGDVSSTRVVDEHVYLLRVTDPQGNVTETPLIFDSELGQAELERQYENARIDCGWEATRAFDGMRFVVEGTNNGDPVIVKGANDIDGDYAYQFEFIWPEDYW